MIPSVLKQIMNSIEGIPAESYIIIMKVHGANSNRGAGARQCEG